MTAGTAVISGAGDALSAALARAFGRDHGPVLAARTGDGMRAVAGGTGARTVRPDATDEAAG